MVATNAKHVLFHARYVSFEDERVEAKGSCEHPFAEVQNRPGRSRRQSDSGSEGGESTYCELLIRTRNTRDAADAAVPMALSKAVEEHDERKASSMLASTSSGRETAFHGLRSPPMSLDKYILRINKSCNHPHERVEAKGSCEHPFAEVQNRPGRSRRQSDSGSEGGESTYLRTLDPNSEYAETLLMPLSEALSKAVEEHDERKASSMLASTSSGRETAFHGLRSPPMSLDKYILRINKSVGCSPVCFVNALAYIDMLTQKDLLHHPSALNIHRLVLIGTMVAAKMVDDKVHRNYFWSKVGGVSLQELNKLELEFLRLMDYRVMVTVDQSSLSGTLRKRRSSGASLASGSSMNGIGTMNEGCDAVNDGAGVIQRRRIRQCRSLHNVGATTFNEGSSLLEDDGATDERTMACAFDVRTFFFCVDPKPMGEPSTRRIAVSAGALPAHGRLVAASTQMRCAAIGMPLVFALAVNLNLQDDGGRRRPRCGVRLLGCL
eukprot:gene3113-13123_t